MHNLYFCSVIFFLFTSGIISSVSAQNYDLLHIEPSSMVESGFIYLNSDNPNDSDQVYMLHQISNHFAENIIIKVSKFTAKIEFSDQLLKEVECGRYNVSPSELLTISYDTIIIDEHANYTLLPVQIEYQDPVQNQNKNYVTPVYTMDISDENDSFIQNISNNFSCDNIEVIDDMNARENFDESGFRIGSTDNQSGMNGGGQQGGQQMSQSDIQTTQEMMQNFMNGVPMNDERPNIMNQNTEQIRDEINKMKERNDRIIQELEQTEEFQSLHDELSTQGLTQQPPRIDINSDNNAEITIPYENDYQESSIEADYENGEISNVRISSSEEIIEFDPFWIIIPVAVVISTIAAFWIKKSKKEKPNKVSTVQVIDSTSNRIETVNFIDSTKQMLTQSKNLYEQKKIKDAYETFGQAIRYYYSNKLELKTEMTTKEILQQLRKQNIQEFQSIQDCLMLCGMIEFAKHRAGDTEFFDAVEKFSKIVSN